MRWLFLLAYTCSGLAGLIYEVSWTRLLTLHLGHTTAASSVVVAAFLGGLAVGAAAGGRIASRLSARQCLLAYAALEIVVAIAAVVLPLELTAATPLLQWAYRDGAPGLLFPLTRLAVCLTTVFVPALALGATFPVAIRWFASDGANPARSTSLLYALNTTGAAVGSLAAGFVLIPAVGVSGATAVGITASTVAALSVLLMLRAAIESPNDSITQSQNRPIARSPNPKITQSRNRSIQSPNHPITHSPNPRGASLAIIVLALSGFAALVHEIAWMRILALVLGPTIYAFAATLAAVVAGVAVGSGLGTRAIGRVRQPAAWLAVTLAFAAVTTSVSYLLAGGPIARFVAEQVRMTSGFDQQLASGLLLTAALIVPTSACLGAAFPLALSIVGASSESASGRFGLVYAINTIGAVSGSLAAGLIIIPTLGLQSTLRLVTGCLVAAAAVVLLWGALARRAQRIGWIAAMTAAVIVVLGPSWDRELLASGVYMYAPYVPKDLDLSALLKAGELLYYREGAGSTVSVKRLTGTTTLAVDGKTDASNRGDMLTQKLVAHLPLLLHDNPREVAIVGLGSGVTLGSALRHPIRQADVIEISREVVEASDYFAEENHHALEDPRTNLIVGDGRSHLLLTRRQYDVIISEPSNPWIAGVAALFTREFFETARRRLAPNGVVCQWANAYNISDEDLRSIVATFLSVFPDGTAWLVGEDDLLLVGSGGGVESRLALLERHWTRSGVAEDLAEVAAIEPFSVLSLYAGGPAELSRSAAGAALLDDDHMRLEFSSPRDIHHRRSGENGPTLGALAAGDSGAAIVRQAKASAGAAQWRHRAAMMARRDAHQTAYDDYVRALTLDPVDPAALDGFVRTAIVIRRSSDALAWIKSLSADRPATTGALIARSKLLAAAGFDADAVDAARQAAGLEPRAVGPAEQLASLHADRGDISALDADVSRLRDLAPDSAPTNYYAAALSFLRGDADETVRLAGRAIAADRTYAPVYDLIGAAYTRLAKPIEASQAFETSLRFDAHDSTAYTNLGLLALASGNRSAATRYFAEALWLAPDSETARDGLARAK